MNTLFLDCSSGISGDMTVAALLDLGADADHLRSVLSSLPLEGYEIEIKRVCKSGIDACDFLVKLPPEHENHDHDMAYLHGSAGTSTCALNAHSHDHVLHDDPVDHHLGHDGQDVPVGHHHDHSDPDVPADHHHTHDGHAPHRNLEDIERILRGAKLTPHALELAIRIFRIVAEAEALVHGKPIREVHFHEVGAVDSIVDIAATAICIDDLKIDRVIIPSLTEGTGQVRCQHGLLPIPVPATAAIVSAHHLPLRISRIQGELVTPTGAAIAAALCTDHTLPESFFIEKTGIGAGKRAYETSGILRAMLIREADPASAQKAPASDPSGSFALHAPEGSSVLYASSGEIRAEQDQILLMQTNLDDCTGEALGFVMNLLMEKGAADVYYTPIYMKKNRPAVLLSVLCAPDLQYAMEDIIFTHTTGIGIRRTLMQRTKLPRRTEQAETPWGPANVKICTWGTRTICYPEYEDAASIARKSGMGIADAMRMIRNTWEDSHGDI